MQGETADFTFITSNTTCYICLEREKKELGGEKKDNKESMEW